MQALVVCPVCLGIFGRCRGLETTRDTTGFDCDGCGKFEVSRTVLSTWLQPEHDRLTAMQRAALSHALRSASRGAETQIITTGWIEAFIPNARLPTPGVQAANLIARIGDFMSETGQGYFIDDVVDTPLVGAFSRAMFDALLKEVTTRGWATQVGKASIPNRRDVGVLQGSLYGLTLAGWERYEAEKRGKFAGRYGFIAMKFGDPVLDPFVDQIVKPAVRDELKYEVVDLRNVSRAGVIDNILRAQIRDAAFVLVDLTHDNAGAYWEAGYAEGLGKPVIYLCEQAKFDAAKTHFDTNHCTTIMWSAAAPTPFLEALIATLRRSLNLFPGS
jgi:hypothetical protein